jgi:hypothetical protein
MKESTLKKEFTKRDVQRMRNLIGGKSGDRTHVQAGWEKNKKEHTEGDVWEENGKQWTIKNGIKQNFTKLDKIKRLVVLPLTCPNCQKPMKVHELNKKMYSIHGVCFDCVIDMESEIKKQGKWSQYVSEQQNNSKNAMLVDLEHAMEAWYKHTESVVTEQGEVESWHGGNKKEIYEQVKQEIQKAKETKL